MALAKKDLIRLELMLKRLDDREALLQKIQIEPLRGSTRMCDKKDADALRKALVVLKHSV